VEAVAAINYREDLLAAFFTIAALSILVATRRRARGQVAGRVAAFVLMLLGVLSKESAAIAPILLVLLEISYCGPLSPVLREEGGGEGPSPPRSTVWPDLLVLVVAVAAATVWRTWVMGGLAVVSRTAEIPAAHRSLAQAVPQGALALLLGVRSLLLPAWRLSPEYDEHAAVWGWVALAALVAALALAWRARRRHPWLAVGVLGATAAYLPTLGLVPITNLRADRYLYLPSLPLLLALAALAVPRLERLPGLRGPPVLELPRPWLALAVLLAAMGLRTLSQGRVWRSDLVLWTQGTALAPGSPRAWNGLAEARLRAGQPRAALPAVRRSLDLLEDPQARELLGLVLMASGDPGQAHQELERALRTAPATLRAELLNNLGACELDEGLTEAALRHFAEASRLDPGYERPRLNSARALRDSGRPDEAVAVLRTLVRDVPSSFEAWAQLGAALEAAGAPAEAREAYRQARALGDPDPAVAAAADRLR
jgi:tetratricopeptide (TPR) repeat protein